MEHQYLWYVADLQEGQLSATFFRSGRASVWVTGNYGRRQEVGNYERQLASDTLDRLLALKRQANFDTLSMATPLMPSTRTTAVGETRDGKQFDLKSWPLFDVPQEVRPLLDESRRTAEQVLESPQRVLRGEGRAATPSFKAGAPVVFDVVFRNTGTEPLEADSPLRTDKADWCRLRLVVSKDVPAGQLKDSDVVWIDLAPQHVHPAPGAVRAAKLSLAPGAELKFQVKRQLLASPGRYRAILIWHGDEPQQQADEVVSGTLRMDLGGFEIAKSR